MLATSNYLEEISFYDTKMWKTHKQIANKSEVNSIIWNMDDSILFVADSQGKINLYDGQILEASSLAEPAFVLEGCH